MVYQIDTRLIVSKNMDDDKRPFVAIYGQNHEDEIPADLEKYFVKETRLHPSNVTKAFSKEDAIVGMFSLLDHKKNDGKKHTFYFVVRRCGIVFYKDDGTVSRLVQRIAKSRKWDIPGIEVFFRDFLEEIIRDDLEMLERYEERLCTLERAILSGRTKDSTKMILSLRRELLSLKSQYDQLIELGNEFAKNEAEIMDCERTDLFVDYSHKVKRLQEIVLELREHTIQLHDLERTQLEVKQNHTMMLLTVLTSIFMPLTLVTSWYGMNFEYMPELHCRYAYPLLIVGCFVILLGGIWLAYRKFQK